MGDIYMVAMTSICSIVAYWYLMGWICVIAIAVMAVQVVIQTLLMKQYSKIRLNHYAQMQAFNSLLSILPMYSNRFKR